MTDKSTVFSFAALAESFVADSFAKSLAIAAKRANEDLITGILLRQAERDVDAGKLSEEIN